MSDTNTDTNDEQEDSSGVNLTEPPAGAVSGSTDTDRVGGE